MALERAYLNHKPRNRIRVLLTRQYAERISDDLHRRAYYNRAKVPGTMAQEQEKMSRECNGKQHDAEDADGKRRRVSNYIVNIMILPWRMMCLFLVVDPGRMYKDAVKAHVLV